MVQQRLANESGAAEGEDAAILNTSPVGRSETDAERQHQAWLDANEPTYEEIFGGTSSQRGRPHAKLAPRQPCSSGSLAPHPTLEGGTPSQGSVALHPALEELLNWSDDET